MTEKNTTAPTGPTCPLDQGGKREDCAAWPACACEQKTTLPAREPDGEFRTFETWVHKATSWIGGTNPLCADAQGRICRSGGDMMRARDEGAFPVRFWFDEGGQNARERRRNRAAARRSMGNFKMRAREAVHGR